MKPDSSLGGIDAGTGKSRDESKELLSESLTVLSFGDGAKGLSFFGGFSVIFGNSRVARRNAVVDARHASATRQRLILAGVWQGWWRTAARIAGDSAAAAN